MNPTKTTSKRSTKPPEPTDTPAFRSRSQAKRFTRHRKAGGQSYAALDMRNRHHHQGILTDKSIEAWRCIYSHLYVIEQTAEGTTHTATLTPPSLAAVQDLVDHLKVAFPFLSDKAYDGLRLQTTGSEAGRPMLQTGEIPEPFVRGSEIGVFTLDFRCGEVPFSVFLAVSPRNHFILPVVAPVFHRGFTMLLAALVKLFEPFAPLSIKLLDPESCHRSDEVVEFLEKINDRFHETRSDAESFFQISEMASFFDEPSYASELRSVTEMSRSAVTSFTTQMIETVALRSKTVPGSVFNAEDSRTLQCTLQRWSLCYCAEGMRRARKNADDAARY